MELPPGTVPALLKRPGTVPISHSAGRASDEGPCEDLTFGAWEQLDRVIFNVINGPDILARGRLHDGKQWWLGRWTLESDDWRATLDNRPNLDELVRELTRTRRQRFTHVGSIERADGSTFTSSDADTVLADLFLFLTLVRGATVGIALPTGFLRGKRVWTRWTSGLSTTYSGHFSWADPHRDADVATSGQHWWRVGPTPVGGRV